MSRIRTRTVALFLISITYSGLTVAVGTPEEEMSEALIQNDIEKVRAIYAAHPRINVYYRLDDATYNNATILWMVAMRGAQDLVLDMLGRNPNPNWQASPRPQVNPETKQYDRSFFALPVGHFLERRPWFFLAHCIGTEDYAYKQCIFREAALFFPSFETSSAVHETSNLDFFNKHKDLKWKMVLLAARKAEPMLLLVPDFVLKRVFLSLQEKAKLIAFNQRAALSIASQVLQHFYPLQDRPKGFRSQKAKKMRKEIMEVKDLLIHVILDATGKDLPPVLSREVREQAVASLVSLPKVYFGLAHNTKRKLREALNANGRTHEAQVAPEPQPGVGKRPEREDDIEQAENERRLKMRIGLPSAMLVADPAEIQAPSPSQFRAEPSADHDDLDGLNHDGIGHFGSWFGGPLS